MLTQSGIDVATDPIPVGPAAHYLMGGIDTDEWGRTSVPALFAAGECACTGVHGANRLASNSLLEGLVFGARAGDAMQLPPEAAPLKRDRVWSNAIAASGSGLQASGGTLPASSLQPPNSALLDVPAIRTLMWQLAGLFRTHDRLTHAVTALETAYAACTAQLKGAQGDADFWRRYNLTTVARLIARAALRREESRGGHFREDFPERDDLHWKVHIVDAAAR